MSYEFRRPIAEVIRERSSHRTYLQTCWVGGTLRRDAFALAMDAGKDEIVPAVSPVGVARVRRRLSDNLLRWAAGSKNRKPCSCSEARDTPA